MSKSKIEWTDHVWNPVTGCTKISPGCQNCYAERMSKRLAGRCGYPKDDPFKVTLHQDRLEEPLHWKKPCRIFACSMGDLFHEDVPFDFIFNAWLTMVSVSCFKHRFLILTKRPERMLAFYQWTQERIKRGICGVEFERNHIWLGVTAENQEQADKRIPVLLQIPAAVRFVSVEPMLGPVDLRAWLDGNGAYGPAAFCKHCGIIETTTESNHEIDYAAIDWVICGGESGPGARPMHRDWVRSLRDQCQAAETSFFFKQWGEWSPAEIEDDSYMLGGRAINDPRGGRMSVAKFPLHTRNNRYWRLDENHLAVKVGKKIAGRLLDGKIWDQFPNVAIKLFG